MKKHKLMEIIKDMPDDAEVCLLADESGAIYEVTRVRKVLAKKIIGNCGPFYCEASSKVQNAAEVIVID